MTNINTCFLKTPMQASAFRFAKECHRGQVRKGTSIPYITHPVEVAKIIYLYHFPEEYIIAALLHDTVEDTEATLEDLKVGFGEEVANIVKYVSEDKLPELSWSERKERYIDMLLNAPEGSVVVSAADKLHNIIDTLKDWSELGDSVFEKFNSGKEKQRWFYRSLTEVYLERGNSSGNEALMRMSKRINKILEKMGM